MKQQPWEAKGISLTPEGILLQRDCPEWGDEIIPPEEEEKAFLTLCAAFHAAAHRYGGWTTVFQPPAPTIGGLWVYGLGPARPKPAPQIPRVVGAYLYTLRDWALLLVEYGGKGRSGIFYPDASFPSGWEAWRKTHAIYDEFSRFVEKARRREYKKLIKGV